jgi:hypothetical protein
MVENQSTYQSTVIADPTSIRQSGNTVNFWFRKGALPSQACDRLIRAMNAKPGDDEIRETFISQMKEQKTVGDVVQLPKHFSESRAVKRTISGRFDDDGLKAFAIEHFQRACRFADNDQQYAFARAIQSQLEDRTYPRELNQLVQGGDPLTTAPTDRPPPTSRGVSFIRMLCS